MSVLSRLFGKKTPQKIRMPKINSLDGMSSEALVGVVLNDVKTEGDEQLRVLAVQKLSDEKSLCDIAFGASSPSMQRLAKQRLAELIDAGQLDFERFRSHVNDSLKLFSIMSFSKQTERLEQLLSSITDNQLLGKMVCGGATVKLRQIAAEKISDKDVLLELLKETKGKDKAVYKIIKDKCDHFKEEEKAKVAIQTAIESVSKAIEHHSNRVFDPQYSAKFQLLKQQWQSLIDQATPELQATTAAAISKCQLLIDSIETAHAHEETKDKDIELTPTDDSRSEVLSALSEMVKVVTLGESDANIEEQRSLLAEQWQKTLDNKKVSVNEQQEFERLNDQIQQLMILSKQYGAIGAHVAAASSVDANGFEDQKMPPLLADLKKRLRGREFFTETELPPVFVDGQAALDQWSKVRADKKAEQQNIQRQIGGLIRKATESVTRGQLKQAVGLRRAIDEKIPLLTNIPAHLQAQLQQLDETLEKLQDWKDYAVLPKKHELIAQMKALLDSTDHPDALATKVKHLQDEWKSLSKGGSLVNEEQDQVLWDEFHQTAQTAYQPCRDYFAEQAAIRQKNLESCQALVQQLQGYYQSYDWDNAQWKDVEKVIHVARQEWRTYTPTERAATQPVKTEFDAVLDAIAQKLSAEQQKNAAVKELLVSQAKQLVELTDMRKGADEVKRLQAQWQQVGITARSTDQKLWRDFRAACDAVFSKKQEESEKFKQELHDNQAQAEALIAELVALQAQSGQTLIDARKQVETLTQSFNNLGALPKNKASEIKTTFTQTVDGFEQKLKQERNAAKQQVWLNLFDANNKLRLFQLAIVDAKTPEAIEQLTADAQAYITSINHWPNGGLKAIEQKLVFSPAESNPEECQHALRMLCIRAEVLTGRATPAADQALRMEYQVKNLEQNFGQKTQDVRAEFDAIIFEWLTIGPVTTAHYDPLFERLYSCWLNVFK